jgi:hypothetical protein
MTDDDQRCFQCAEPTATEILGPFSGADEPFVLTVHGLPVEVCANGHRQFAQSRLALQRLLNLGDTLGDALPMSAEKGRLFKRVVCRECNVALERTSHERETFHLDMQVGAAPRFGIDLTLPVCRCPRCGVAHAPSRKELRGRAPAALLDALRAAGIGQA